MLLQVQKLSVTARCHGRMSRQDVSDSQQKFNAGSRIRKSQQQVSNHSGGASEYLVEKTENTRQVYSKNVIAKNRKKMSQQDATEGCQGKMRQRCATARGHSRMSQQAATAR